MKQFYIYLLAIFLIISCDPYLRTEVQESLYINQQSLNMFVGEQFQLTASPTELTYDWESEDNSVVTVTASGLVLAVGPGSTYIIASSGKRMARIPVTATVKVALEDLEVVSELELSIGEKIMISSTPVPATANDFNRFEWSSNNEKVATVNSSGEVTGMGLGKAIITCKVGNISKTILISIFRTDNVALNKPATASSIYQNSSVYLPSKAVDGILNTSDNTNRWLCKPTTTNGPQWIAVDLQQEYEIFSVQFWTQSSWPPISFQFQKEVDGEWVDIFSESNNTSVAYSKTFEVTKARKVRLYFTNGARDGIVRMYEMVVNAKVYE